MKFILEKVTDVSHILANEPDKSFYDVRIQDQTTQGMSLWVGMLTLNTQQAMMLTATLQAGQAMWLENEASFEYKDKSSIHAFTEGVDANA